MASPYSQDDSDLGFLAALVSSISLISNSEAQRVLAVFHAASGVVSVRLLLLAIRGTSLAAAPGSGVLPILLSLVLFSLV